MSRHGLVAIENAVADASAGAEPSAGETTDHALLFRKVEGLSIALLNEATVDVRGKKVERVLDHFRLPLVYDYKLEEARHYSTFERPPRAEDVAEVLETVTDSLADPVTATILDVKPHHTGGIAAYVDYSEGYDEQREMILAAQETLRLPEARPLGPQSLYITILKGRLPRLSHATQLDRLRDALSGEEIALSSVQRPTATM